MPDETPNADTLEAIAELDSGFINRAIDETMERDNSQ